ncbi:proline racemase family protein, partial [Desulforhopalus singaporensis]
MIIKNSFTSIDTHTGGEPTRTITGGIPYIPGDSIAEKMLYLKKNMDWIRTSLMFEPRGHSVMSGVILTEPKHPEADVGAIFIETGGYLPMCGHDTIGMATALVETGMVPVTEPETFINLDTPAGLTRVRVRVENGRACEVTFLGVPSFVFEKDLEIEVPAIGRLTLDIAYGGNVYAILPAADV